ncbi:LysR family transcriptional regulator [Saccharopolyspora sp. TS4A08]|uniref:LysR family transcriptional regulator n=1 Tax=Saccharopolyspora ipomoeae TaxID=3042027 RepID=A0ABT6PJZ0_9PSEU|nr:LysR family transcriptional regulator [Saccharopolyspora sp. TS4A08]MDI2028170.1 LysR family transcriptional regulator [Saccharopolyspora sp. TS4A08]
MELPELDDLQFFDGIARATTLTGSARQWGVNVSTVSKRLARLERRLGVQLVNRSTRRLSLTAEGRRYAEGAGRLLGQIADLEDDIGEQRAGLRGRISVHSSIGLGRAHIAPLLGELAAAHSDLEVDLELSHLPVHVAGTPYDFAVRVGRLPDSRLHARLLHANRRVVCAAPGYLERRGEPRTLPDLAEHDCIVIRENDTDFMNWRFGEEGDQAVRVAGAMVSNDGDVATEWCLAGRGMVMRSLWQVAPLLRDGRLVQVLPEIPSPRADIYALSRPVQALPRRAREAIEHLRRGLATRLPEID